MRNFLRAVRASWPYRGRLFLSIAFAIAAASLWGAMFLAIHPMMKILGGEKSLPESVEVEIALVEKDIEPLRAKLAKLDEEKRQLEKIPETAYRHRREREITGQIAQTESRLTRASVSIYRLQILKWIYSNHLPADRFQCLVALMGAVLVVVLFKGIFEFGHESLSGSITNWTQYDLRNRFYRNVIRLDVNHFNDAGSHELMARFTNDIESLSAGLKMIYGKVIAEPLKGIACLGLAFMISWQLTLLFLVVVPLAVIAAGKVGKMIKRASKRLLERMSDIFKILHESFRGIRIVKAFTMEPYERLRFRSATQAYRRKAQRIVELDAASGPIMDLIGSATVATAIIAGAYLVLRQKTHLFGLRMTDYPLDHETLLLFYGLLGATADPARKLSSVYTKIMTSVAAANRVFNALDVQPRVRGNVGAGRLERHCQSIEFRDICFSYEPGKPILTNIHLHCRFGETVALVGKNGCGKTTLVGLIPRFYDPDHGTIRIDGTDIRSVNLRSLRQQIGVVTQETILFDDTIFNNIAYGHRHAKPSQVEEAAERAFAHDFIMKLPKGYQTMIGEAGGKLSGGQKQRIALARAILRDPAILILDEFTSQCDAESESLMHQALRKFMQGRTNFVITHRLNTLEIADRIVVLDNGRIESAGTHDELLKCSPIYQRLYEAHLLHRAA
jgi:ATP-binding cassette subfamily B protein/subfamily B ATP-binding cassette protein MsbA